MIGEIGHIKVLTAAVFRVTGAFNHSEILRNKIQEKALDIFSQCNPHFNEAIIKDINILKNFLRLARDLELTKKINCEALIREYDKLISNFFVQGGSAVGGKFSNDKKNQNFQIFNSQNANRGRGGETMGDPPNRRVSVDLTGRQEQILNLFRSKNELRLREISKNFPNITSRTIRNDLNALIINGRLRRDGMGSGSVYLLNSKF